MNAPGSATEMAHIGKACALLRASFERSMRIWTPTTFVLSAPTRASNGSGLTVRRDSGEANWSADALRGRCRKCLTRLDAEFGRLVHRHGLGARQVWFTVSRDAEFGLRDLGTAWWEIASTRAEPLAWRDCLSLRGSSSDDAPCARTCAARAEAVDFPQSHALTYSACPASPGVPDLRGILPCVDSSAVLRFSTRVA